MRRYGAAGDLDIVVSLPVSRPTCCASDGEDLREIYIATAQPDSAEEREVQPLSGPVFSFRLDVPGSPPDRVQLLSAGLTRRRPCGHSALRERCPVDLLVLRRGSDLPRVALGLRIVESDLS